MTPSILAQARRIVEVLRFKPFDVSTDEGRSKERYRRVMLSAAASGLAKATTAATALISIPLTVNYLGAERYGLWMTVNSVIAMLGFADLGMGNGLMNAIAEAHGRDDRAAARRVVSSGFFMLSGVAALILVFFSLLYPVVTWPRVFNVTTELAAREAGPALAVFVICFALGIPLGVVERVQLGFQEGFAGSLWQMVGSLGGLIGVLLAIHFHAGLPWLVLAMAGSPLLATALNGALQFFHRRPWLRPQWQLVEGGACRRLANLGVLFLILQMLALIGSASDNLIVAQIFGASAVAGYAVTQKLFAVAALSQFFVTPLWPAFGEALARRDFAWARRALDRALLLSVTLTTLAAALLFVFGRRIIGFWTSEALAPSVALLGGFACYAILSGYGGVMSAFLNSGPLLGRQVWFYSAASIAALILKVALAGQVGETAGVVWATVLAYGTLYAIPAWILSHRFFSRRFDG